MKPHKWAKEIHAWADGAEIEEKIGETWHQVLAPTWNRDRQYRIKSQPKTICCKHGIEAGKCRLGEADCKPDKSKPDVYLYVYQHETKGLSLGFAPHAALNMWKTKIVGKIPLEQDDD